MAGALPGSLHLASEVIDSWGAGNRPAWGTWGIDPPHLEAARLGSTENRVARALQLPSDTLVGDKLETQEGRHRVKLPFCFRKVKE